MQISKQTAMSLIKVLSHYNSITMCGGNFPVVNNVDELLEDFESYILEIDDDKKTFSDTIKIDADLYPEALCELPGVSGHINNSSAGDPGDDIKLSFRKVSNDESGEVDTFLMTNDCSDSIGPITYLRLFDRELQVATGQGSYRTWHYFDIETVPTSWVRVFGQSSNYFRVINWQ